MIAISSGLRGGGFRLDRTFKRLERGGFLDARYVVEIGQGHFGRCGH